VAAIAGGDSFSDIYGMRRFFYVALPQLLVLLLGKKLFLLPQTLGPFKGKLTQIIAKYIMSRASLTYSRDYDGLKEMKKLLAGRVNSGRLRFCYDVGFVVDPIAPAKIDWGDFCKSKNESTSVVGFNISGLLFMGGYTRNDMFGLKVDYKTLVYDVLDLFMSKPGVVVLLVPHVFGAPDHAESDAAVCEKIYQELQPQYEQKLFLARGRYSQNEIKHIIGLCDFFVGSRMHACIAALSQSIPAVAIAYSKKFSGVMQTIGMESLVADPRLMGKEEILRHLEEAYARRNLLRERLRQKMPEVKNTVLNLFAEIKASAPSLAHNSKTEHG
jgi:polysaccharide pyruvyl transferase WcaK-like protein